ncbi:MAG: hypothetical protein IJN64_00545 [Lachnospiraceae bacterium]|nr:hypothetical protein [Lachnospiraceae bacterium]
MLTVVLTILKWIGITILMLLGILIFILCLILFVPIRYKADGFYKDSYQIRARVTWLFHFISFSLEYEKEQPFRMKLRILGISIFDNLKKKDKKSKKTNRNTSPEIVAASKEEQNSSEAVKEITKAEKTTIQGQDTVELKDISISETTVDEDMGVNREVDEFTFIQKVKLAFSKAIGIFRNIKYTIRRICDTIKELKDNITYYIELLKKDSTKAAFVACKKQLLRIFKNLRPQKFQVNLYVGMDDPATMGDILGVWGMLYPIHQGYIDLCPNFEQAVLEGDFYCKGRITVYIYIWTILIVLFDKDIRRLRKCLVRKGK